MAGESLVPNDFGIISSSTVLTEDLENFFNDGVVAPIKKKEEAKEEDPKKIVTVPKEGPKVLTEADLLGEDEEDSETEEVETTEDSEDESKNEEESGIVDFESIADGLYNIGLFTDEEGEERPEIKTPEQFRDRFILESQRQVGVVLEKFLNSKGDEARDIFDAVLINGVSPKEYLEKHVNIQNVEGLDLKDELVQEKIVRELYRREGKKDIDAKIEKLKTYGDLEETAIEAQELILTKDKESIEQDKLLAKNKELQKAQMRQEYVQSVSRIIQDKASKKEFDGIPVSPQFAQEVGTYITREAFETPKGEKLTTFEKDILDLNKPENYEMKVKIAMLYKLLQKDPTLSTIQKSGVSKETNTLFNKLAQKSTKIKDKTEKQPAMKSWFN